MLMRFDPFRDIDRVFDQAFTTARQTSMPMDVYRHGESFVVHFDLPAWIRPRSTSPPSRTC